MFYIIEADGTFVGGWNDKSAADVALTAAPGRSIVPFPPDDARQKWNGKGWDAAPPLLAAPSLQDVLIKKGIVTAADFTPVTTTPVATVEKSV